MLSDVMVEMMSDELILWRCLHGGPLTEGTIDQPEPHPRVPWERLRARNLPVLRRLIRTYGSCAVIARDNERIVGQLRFYPRAVLRMVGKEPHFCMQQTSPNGPPDDFAESSLPSLDEIADKTLFVHCMMTGSPQQDDNPYQRTGLGSRMVRTLIDWARGQGWEAVEANAYADLPSIYAITGQAGKTFWEKLGFSAVLSEIEPAFVEDGNDGFVRGLLAEAADLGMDPDTARTRYTMRLDLA
jgi:hypothetical protein